MRWKPIAGIPLLIAAFALGGCRIEQGDEGGPGGERSEAELDVEIEEEQPPEQDIDIETEEEEPVPPDIDIDLPPDQPPPEDEPPPDEEENEEPPTP